MTAWDHEQLWLKAKAFIEEANEIDHSKSEFPLWSSLALELLARAALCNVHPSLNADPSDVANLLFACGLQVSAQPRSVPTHSVYLRLKKVVTGFGKTQRELCDYLSLLRNQELHTADLPFHNLGESKWLPRFYETCKILCTSLGKSLDDFLGEEVAGSAEKLIALLNREIEGNVKSKVAAHARVFAGKSEEERQLLGREAAMRTRALGRGAISHACPSCTSAGVLRGELIKELPPVYEDEQLFTDEERLATDFECHACGLKLNTLDEIVLAGIEPRFIRQRSIGLHELAQSEVFDEYDNM